MMDGVFTYSPWMPCLWSDYHGQPNEFSHKGKNLLNKSTMLRGKERIFIECINKQGFKNRTSRVTQSPSNQINQVTCELASRTKSYVRAQKDFKNIEKYDKTLKKLKIN